MYNLIEYSSNYSKTARRLWFYFKYEANNFDNDIENAVSFNFFKYKAKLLENRDDQPTQIEALEKGVLQFSKFSNCCAIKSFEKFLEITQNAIN